MIRAARAIALALSLVACAALAPPADSPEADRAAEARTAAYFDAVREHPLLLALFLREMPKGGDLHNHLSGAVYAESYVRWAAEGGLCVDRATAVLSPPPCDAAAGRPPAAAALAPGGGALHGFLVDQWSMRNFVPGVRSGHDWFFDSFGKFGRAGRGRSGDSLAEVLARAAGQRELYVELMSTLDGSAAGDLGARVGYDADLARLHERLVAAGLTDAVTAARRALDATETAARERLRCGATDADSGCGVQVRWLYQVLRAAAPERVFAQMALGFALAQADRRVVGLNLVQPEDDPVAMRDYELHMTMLDWLHQKDPGVSVALHAGELAPGLVPPEGLCCHIRLAVERGHARRIGHGVSVAWERDPEGLLRLLAERRVLVEIALTSNDVILGVRGPEHPLALYLRAGVPVALATDDEGVNRSDLTREYLRAALEHDLRYHELKASARQSLEHSFLPGPSLWASVAPWRPVPACAASRPEAAAPAPACADFLAGSEHARLQWRLEGDFARFERRF
jgi:hypothetical protein